MGESFQQLRERVRASLRQSTIDLWDRIEATTRLPVEVAHNEHPPPLENPNAAATQVEAGRAVILLRESAPISERDVLHELLHIERYWLERVPQLEPLRDHPSN